MSTYPEQFDEALLEAVMLLHINHPIQANGAALEGDLPQSAHLIRMCSDLQRMVIPVMLGYIQQGENVEDASELAMVSVLSSALELGFATGRVFQAHGYDVPQSAHPNQEEAS